MFVDHKTFEGGTPHLCKKHLCHKIKMQCKKNSNNFDPNFFLSNEHRDLCECNKELSDYPSGLDIV